MKNSIKILLFSKVGNFAENKDVARDIRLNKIVPALIAHKHVIIDFTNVESTTQSFVHALISDLLRKYGSDVLDEISFKNCNQTIQKIINIVIDYMQHSN